MNRDAWILETERLRLREMTEADAENLWRLNANPNVVRYVGEPSLKDVDAALDVLRVRVFPQYREHGLGRWAVVSKESGAFLGWCGLKYLAQTKEYDLGYRFAEEHWGKGYATESARAVLAWGLPRLPGARIIGQAHVANTRSIRVLQKLGLRFEREVRDAEGVLAIYVAETGRVA
jgi:[ribosomal protein S5]-alanine N-acetyltransferase